MQDIIYYNNKSTTLYTLFGSIKPTLCYIYAPIAPIYEQILKKYHFTIEHINIHTNINKIIEPNSMIIFSNPNCIDGEYYDLEDLLNNWIDKNITIIIDESFLDFTSHSSTTRYLQNYDKLFIVVSLKYFYDKYDTDLTYIKSSSSNIISLKNNEPYEELSKCNESILNDIKNDKSYKQVKKVVNITKKEKVYKLLQNCKNIKNIFSSTTNRILVEVIDQPDNNQYFKIENTNNIRFLDNSYKIVTVV
jgi:threonine-phosphate decarboxylase